MPNYTHLQAALTALTAEWRGLSSESERNLALVGDRLDVLDRHGAPIDATGPAFDRLWDRAELVCNAFGYNLVTRHGQAYVAVADC